MTSHCLVVALVLASLGTPAAVAGAPSVPARDTLARVVPLPEIVVSTTRLGERAPVARATLGRDELVRVNVGLDTPMLLATLPGAYAYSDAGNGIGYSYLAIRGFPQRRISVLVNGVPLNDPESNEVYWIDHPDLLASTSEVQVQRGVGSALYGGASVGGSVNLETSPFSERPATSVTLAYGAWETRRLMLETNSGRLAGGWSFYGRYSRIETSGYRDQSWSKLWSYALAARRVSGDHTLRVNLYGGPENTHLAYLGVPAPYLDGRISGDAARDRRFNPLAYAGEQDHFFEPHYELLHDWTPGHGFALSQTLFWFDGTGYYDEQRFGRSLADYRLSSWTTTDSTMFPAQGYYERDSLGRLVVDGAGRVRVIGADLVRRRTVWNRQYGWVPRLRLEHAGGALTVGGEFRAHASRHVGTVVSGSGLPPGTEPDHRYYDYGPRTLEAGLFAREEWQPHPRLTATADLAWRHQRYDMGRDRFDDIRFDRHYDFALPRLGLAWAPRADVTVFGAWSQSAREPAFRNLYDAESAGSTPLFVDGVPVIRPERVNDFELGGTWRGPRASLSANLFRMDFRDELVDYQFNSDLGSVVPANAARSVHQGLELAGRLEHPLPRGARLSFDGNAGLSDNRFVRYTEVFDATTSVSHDGKIIGFFPAVLGNLAARVDWRGATLGVDAQHAGRMYLDNTQDAVASIGPRTTVNAVAGWGLAAGERSRAELLLRVTNVLDTRYAAGGYMDYDADGAWVPQFIPAATRGWLAQLRVGF